MNNAETTAKSKTLAEELSEGRLPVQDGLRYAALLAEALRKIHDDGRAHGGVTPDVIALDGIGLELLPASTSGPRVTPYTAPEVAGQYRPADSRSDIFSFGAIVYEMLTGHAAFAGDSEAVLVSALCNTAAAPTGSPAVDRLVGGCLQKDPAARWQRMQKIILELKLLTAAAKRTATPAAVRRDPAAEAALRAEMHQMESRLAARLQAHADATAQGQQALATNLRSEFAGVGDQTSLRLQAHEQSAAQIHQSVLQAINELRGQIAASNDAFLARLSSQEQAAAQSQVAMGDSMRQMRAEFSAAHEQISGRLQEHQQSGAQAHQAIGEAMNQMRGEVSAAQERLVQRLTAHEQAAENAKPNAEVIDALRGEIAAAHEKLSAQVQAHVEASAGAQRAANESVDALKSQLQSIVGQLAAAHEKLEQTASAPDLSKVHEHIESVHGRIAKLEESMAAGAGSANVEAGLEALKQHVAELHTNVAADMHEFELNMKAQANAIESARTAMAQTDDLVERVVEALESLQSTVLEHADDRTMALN